jgi:hypothetical protein
MKALEKRPELRYPTMDEFTRAMSDPVSYVEANGGVAGFPQRTLTASTDEMPPPRLTTPTALTPMPGSVVRTPTPAPGLLSPVPGTLSAPAPTTLGAAAGEVAGAGRKKTGFIIGGAVVALVAAVGVFMAVKGGGGDKDANGSGSATAVATAGSGSSATAGTPPDHKTVAVVDDKQPKPTETGSGSAAVKAPVTPDIQNMVLKLTSEPPGAEIFYNGSDTNKKTPAALTIRLDHTKGEFRLRLKGYDEYVLKDVPFDGDLEQGAKLKKTVLTTTGHGHGSGSGGRGSGHHDDTGLMAP